MEDLSILVTGGADFIGSHLVDALIERGHRVRVLDALVTQVHGKNESLDVNKEAEFIRGDVRDPAMVERADEGMDIIYHQAAEVALARSPRRIG
jgi:dTDP-L-rhamnose 4-epimerase